MYLVNTNSTLLLNAFFFFYSTKRLLSVIVFYTDDRAIQILGTSDFLLMSKSSLPKFVNNDVIDASTNFTLPNLHPLRPTIDLQATNNYYLEPFDCKFIHICANKIISLMMVSRFVKKKSGFQIRFI